MIIGTRGSELALWQANRIKELLQTRLGVGCTLQIIKTQGDQIQNIPLSMLDGKGFFTRELEEALLDGRIDLAVHSMKDLPTTIPPGLKIVAVPERNEPADRLLIRAGFFSADHALNLKHGARVGTSSNRRIDQLKRLRPDLETVPIRGNVPTRIARLKAGITDAIILAAAGLNRLNADLSGLTVLDLDPETWIPAPAQGALAIECRDPDDRVQSVLKQLHQSDLAELIDAERGFLALTEGGCHAAVGAVARREGSRLVLTTYWNNRILPVHAASAPAAAARAFSLHQALEVPRTERIWLVRNHDEVSVLANLLESAGFSLWLQPAIHIRYDDRPSLIRRAGSWASTADGILFTSRNAVFWTATRLPATLTKPVLAIGPGTAAAARQAGYPDVRVSASGNTAALPGEWATLADSAWRTVFYPVSHAADTSWIQRPELANVRILPQGVYFPEPVPLPEQPDGVPDTIVAYSASAVPGIAGWVHQHNPQARWISVGPKTSQAIRQAGFSVAAEAAYPSTDAILSAILTPTGS